MQTQEHPPGQVNSVLIIDDHDIVRFGLETLINASPDLRLVGSVGSLEDGLRVIAERAPAVVISDMSMDDSKGLDTVRAVVAAQGPRRTLIVSMHDEMLYGEQALTLGAHGYVMKENAFAVVVTAALAVLQGQTWVSPRLSTKILNRLLQRGRPAQPAEQGGDTSAVTLRELQVLELLRTGKTTKEIAYELGLSSRTVDLYRASIKKKLGLRSGAELIAFALSKT